MAKKKKIFQNVHVVSIADKGLCIGKNEEGTVFLIERAVPGDVIDLATRRKKKGLYYGSPERTIRFSPDRVDPVCEYFGDCGGCKWQNLDYSAQLQQKEEVVKSAICRIGKQENVLFDPIIGADKIYQYRNKLEYSFSSKRWITSRQIAHSEGEKLVKENALGFHAPGVFDKIVDIQTCHLQPEPSNKIKNLLRDYALEHGLSFYDYKAHKGFLRTLIVRTSSTGQVMVTVIFGQNDIAKIESVMSFLVDSIPEITTAVYIVNTKLNDSYFDLDYTVFSGAGFILEQLGDVRYKIRPKSFFQTNTEQAKKLYDTVVEFAGLQTDDTVYDLYTGVGSIALYIARSAHKVIGIETVDTAIIDACENAALNNFNNVSFVKGDVKEILKEDFRKKYGDPDVVITDPPRAGMHPDTVEGLLRLRPKRIVYVSCNPSTQARDILRLSEKYRVDKVRPVDMFPHTSHVESIALLVLKPEIKDNTSHT